jgi:5-formyltetrahydrofolate cyclo-ligase
MREEIDPRPLLTTLAARGHPICLPTVPAARQALLFRQWRPGDALVAGAYGTEVPGPEAPALTPQVLIVPLLAFDEAGYRLGYGGGFYDRTLDGLRPQGAVLAIGAAYAGQACEAVPHDDHDQKLDWIVTEHSARRIVSAREAGACD